MKDPNRPSPADPMTAQDGARLQITIQDLSDTLKQVSNRMALLQRNNIDIMELLTRIDAGLSENRVGRLEVELRETELERDLAEQRLKALDEKLTIKKNVTIKAEDTNEKIRSTTAAMYADLERQKKEAREAFLQDLKRSAIKYVINALALAGTLGVIGFIWWLFQMYLNR